MASDATKSHIFQQLFSIRILTKLSYWWTGGTGALTRTGHSLMHTDRPFTIDSTD